MNINDVINIVRRVHDAEDVDLGSRSTRESRNAFWARAIGIVHWGHSRYNPTPDRQWHIKNAGGGRPQSDDVVVSMPSRESWDCVPGAGSDGYRFRANAIGVLSAEQNVYAPPRPEDSGHAPEPQPQPQPNPEPSPQPTPPSATYYARLERDQYIAEGTYLRSPNRQFSLTLQLPGDGNVGVWRWDGGVNVRSAGVTGATAVVVQQVDAPDGPFLALLAYNAEGGLVASITDDDPTRRVPPDGYFEVQDDGNLVGKTADGQTRWAWMGELGQLTEQEPPPDVVPQPGQPGPGPSPQPGSRRFNGRLRVHGGNQAFGDDDGPRADIYVIHMGDLVPRWMYAKLRGDQGQLDECRLDLDDAAEASGGSALLRSWWYLDYHPAGSIWHSHKYDGLHHDRIGHENFVQWGVDLVNEVAERGMRICIGPGGVGEHPGELTRDEEATMFRLYRRIADGAGHEKIAWAEGVNEASSGGTSDEHDDTRGTQDNSPENLLRLVRIVIDGTEILGHLSYWKNDDYREAARYLASFQKYNYTHSSRAGNMFTKIDRHFTWCRIFVEQTGRENGRLTLDGEGPGHPTEPGVPGDLLTRVSATGNGHEMDNAEGFALTVVAHNVRGIGCLMSGNGVRRYQRFTNVIGWREVPWILSKLPSNLHEWIMLHGGMNDERLFLRATRNGNGVLGRADQVVSPDGRFFVALIYNEEANQHQSYPWQTTARFTCYDTGRMSESPHTVHGGGTFDLGMYWGRVLVGEAV